MTCPAAATSNPIQGAPPDVLLDIPNVSVDRSRLLVENLTAHVSLDARVGNLVKLTAGVDAGIRRWRSTSTACRRACC